MEDNKNILEFASVSTILRIPYFVLTISIIFTVAISYFYYSSAKKNDFERFQNETLRVKGEIESKLETYKALLRAGRSFFYSTDEVNREKFKQFVDNLNLRKNYQGVLAIGFTKVFKPEEKDALIKKMKSEGFDNFTLTPNTPRDEYQAIIYVEPFDERNQKAIGFDMSSEKTRQIALDSARDTGIHSVSGKVILIQENEINKQNGFLMFFPVYKSKSTPQTIEERKKEIDGFIYSPFRAGDFINDVIQTSEINDISCRIYDNELLEENFLVSRNEEIKITDDYFIGQNEVLVGGRNWIITYSPTNKFYRQSLTWWTPIIFILGLGISVVLFYLSLSQSKTNQRLIKTAYELAQTGENEKEARQIAEKSSQVKDDFLATVSHELRTPLNAISGWVNILQMDNVEAETKEKAINIINKNIRQQVNLIDQMIIFSDMDSFLSQTNWQKFSLNELITHCINESIVQISKKKLNLVKNLSDEELFINGDREKVKKVLNILLENSIKFTPENGEIMVNLDLKDNEAILEFIDTGEGINPELLPNIFEGFKQSDTSSVRKYGGLGLSLAISKKIIESHQGTIKIESEGKNLGSKITTIFPISN